MPRENHESKKGQRDEALCEKRNGSWNLRWSKRTREQEVLMSSEKGSLVVKDIHCAQEPKSAWM